MKQKTIKVSEIGHELLRLVAALRNESMYKCLENVLETEKKRLLNAETKP